MATLPYEDDRNPGDAGLGREAPAQISSLATTTAARTLGVTPNTLRAWEERFGFPHAGIGAGGRRQFATAEIWALRAELHAAASVPVAVRLARERLAALSSPAQVDSCGDPVESGERDSQPR